MDPLLESYLVGVAGSVTAEWLSKGGLWVLRRTPVDLAIRDTARGYEWAGGRDVTAALKRWVEGDAFCDLLVWVRKGDAVGVV